MFVGADPNTNDAGDGYYGGFACAGAPSGEASQVAVAVSVHDPSGNPAPGATVEGVQCYTPLPDEPGWSPGCGWLVKTTGAQVAVPSTGTTTSGSTPGGSAGTGTGTCVYANGTTPAPGLLCPSGVTVAGTNIATGDANVSTRTVPGGCVGAAGNPCTTTVPSGAAVTAGGGDSANKTVDGSVLVIGPVQYDLAKTCLVNVFTDCTTP